VSHALTGSEPRDILLMAGRLRARRMPRPSGGVCSEARDPHTTGTTDAATLAAMMNDGRHCCSGVYPSPPEVSSRLWQAPGLDYQAAYRYNNWGVVARMWHKCRGRRRAAPRSRRALAAGDAKRMNPVLKTLLGTLFFLTAAVGLGLYVFPQRPYLAWCLLFLCWACYRLRLRALRLFGRPAPSPEVSGNKGGEVRSGATAPAPTPAGTYEEWRRCDRTGPAA